MPPCHAGNLDPDIWLGIDFQNHLTLIKGRPPMAITTKSALAAELSISKARVSQYVKQGLPVRPDGKLNRDEALNWIKRNQLSQGYEDKGVNRARKLAEDRPKRPASPPARRPPAEDILLDSMADRLDGWREIYVEATPEDRAAYRQDIDAVAATFLLEPPDILRWLRAGCPYVQEGDWETGEGFVLHGPWVSEWAGLVMTRLDQAGNIALEQALGMDRGILAR